MIEIKPKLGLEIECPECGSEEVSSLSVSAPGMHWLVDCVCQSCGLAFWQSLPVGHTIEYRLGVSKKDGKLYGAYGDRCWQAEPFLRYCAQIESRKISIRRKGKTPKSKVCLLNALDFIYGHTLLKLFNASYHIDQHDVGLIVIIPKSFEWLIPTGCDEAWIVDLPLGEFRNSYTDIADFIRTQCERFDKVYVSYAYSHPDFSAVDITRFIDVQPFDLSRFSALSPVFTFVLREDRWWLKSPESQWVFKVADKLGLGKLGKRFLTSQQNSLVRKTIRHIRKELPEAQFNVVGLGTTGDFSDIAVDKRRDTVTPEIEHDWCLMYARSHVVIGVHGSNMLLPTAFAAGCVEIFPDDRMGNYVQDLCIRYNDRRQLYMYRLADNFSTPASVARKAVTLCICYEDFNKNMLQNLYFSPALPLDAPAPSEI